jgi:ABC-type oligopeptide transport system ATPase subunit
MTAEPVLEVEGLRKFYPVGKTRAFPRARSSSLPHAVDGVSFAIRRGETVGLVGESGCGKSTLARLLARLIDPSEGRIRFEGEEIGGISARQFGHNPLRAQIQMVFQMPPKRSTRAIRRFGRLPIRCSACAGFPAPHCASGWKRPHTSPDCRRSC